MSNYSDAFDADAVQHDAEFPLVRHGEFMRAVKWCMSAIPMAVDNQEWTKAEMDTAQRALLTCVNELNLSAIQLGREIFSHEHTKFTFVGDPGDGIPGAESLLEESEWFGPPSELRRR